MRVVHAKRRGRLTLIGGIFRCDSGLPRSRRKRLLERRVDDGELHRLPCAWYSRRKPAETHITDRPRPPSQPRLPMASAMRKPAGQMGPRQGDALAQLLRSR